MFERLLVANRGEIAVRIMRACRELGIESVAVYSDADRDALHTTLADRAVRIGPAKAADSYLSVPALLDAARKTGATAIHPGYGFLSENSHFAAACEEAGVVFIGPPADVLARMGSKITAREIAAGAGVPIVPGHTPKEQSDAAVIDAARHIGCPLLIKPSAGGGGIGMKAVHSATALPDAVAQARREATAAFGDGTLYLERLIERPRHIEFQIIVDHQGHAVHLFERECSLQRRHQKVVEETPSPALDAALRAQMGAAAIRLAMAAGYRNAGTVEFLLEGAGAAARFYFLEMNARLQVEHPITEAVTGVDLVRAQILIAAGQPLPWTQSALSQRGHAIEVRLYAEDPAQAYLPQAGTLAVYRPPAMPGIRIDSGVIEGSEVSVHYDPLLAKVIAYGETRETARQRALAALGQFPVLGVRTNQRFALALLAHPRFIRGDLDIEFLATEEAALGSHDSPATTAAAAAVAQAARQRQPATFSASATDSATDPWTTLGGLRV
jgi:acetyl-CoA/propionyl-CoA carboxylase biotin carboxyl carrier protein